MNEIITKELLSEVLGYEVEVRGFIDKYIPSNFEYIKDLIDVKIINIYELEYRLKEWALYKGYLVFSGVNICYIMKKNDLNIDYFTQLSKEFENTIIACQYIFEKINKEG